MHWPLTVDHTPSAPQVAVIGWSDSYPGLQVVLQFCPDSVSGQLKLAALLGAAGPGTAGQSGGCK